MAITETTRPDISVVVGPMITTDCTSVVMNCCSSRSTNNSDGGTEISGEDWSIKTIFDVEANANVNAAAAPIAAAAAASESSTFTNSGIQDDGGSANSIPASPAAAATAAAAAAAESAAAIAAATASPTWEDDLQAQMQEWFRDSDWVDEPPSIAVTMGSGAMCQLDSTATVALPPDAVFNVIRDPNNRRVFKNVKSVSDVRVLRDDGAVQHAEMIMTFIWRLPAISGTFTTHVLMIQDRPNRMLSYELTRPGFMKKFQGFWKVEPHVVPSSSSIGRAGKGDDDCSSHDISSGSSQNNPSNTMSKSNSHDSTNSNTGSGSNEPGDSSDSSRSPVSILSYDSCPDLLAFAETAEAAGTASVLASPSDASPGSATKSHDAATEGALSAATAEFGAVAAGGGEVSPAPSAAAKRVASRIVLHQIVQPSVAPPPVFRKCLKGILQSATRDMLQDFQIEAARIRCGGERLGETEEGGKEAQIARERAEKRTASFLHKETLRASGLSPRSKVSGSGGFAANLGKKVGMNLVKGAINRSKKGLTSLAKAGRK